MSGKRTGEVTEDYATYARHLFTAGAVGAFFGSVATLIGIYTNWYSIILQRTWPILLAIVFIVLLISYFKSNSKARKKQMSQQIMKPYKQANQVSQTPQNKRTRG